MRVAVRLITFFFVSLLALTIKAETAATLPSPTGYIDDYANVLSAPAKTEFEALCVEVHDKTKAQVFVVIVNNLGDTQVDQFANDLFHHWKIGEKKTDRGVLLLFSVHDHKWRIEVGYGLESSLNDAKVGDIGRSMVPALHASRWDDGIRTGLQSVAQVIADDAKVQLANLQTVPTEPEPQPISEHPASSKRGGWIFFSAFAAVWLSLFGFGIASMFRSKSIRRRGSSAGSGGWFSSSSSSSDSSSSSSDDFGGGDGGDSGGGGASGDF